MAQASFKCSKLHRAMIDDLPRSMNFTEEFNALIKQYPPQQSKPVKLSQLTVRLDAESEKLVSVLSNHGSASEYYRSILEIVLDKYKNENSPCLHLRTTCDDCGAIPFKRG